MANNDDLDLTLPWDAEAPVSGPALLTTMEQRPLEEYTAFLEDIGALRSPPLETKVFEEPFTL